MKTFKALLETEIERKSIRHSFIEVLSEELELIRKARNVRVSHSKIASYLKEAGHRVSAAEVRQFCMDRGLESEAEKGAKPLARKRHKKKSVKQKATVVAGSASTTPAPEPSKAFATTKRLTEVSAPRAGFRTPIGDDL